MKTVRRADWTPWARLALHAAFALAVLLVAPGAGRAAAEEDEEKYDARLPDEIEDSKLPPEERRRVFVGRLELNPPQPAAAEPAKGGDGSKPGEKGAPPPPPPEAEKPPEFDGKFVVTGGATYPVKLRDPQQAEFLRAQDGKTLTVVGRLRENGRYLQFVGIVEPGVRPDPPLVRKKRGGL